jgi:thioredoxin reductase (NADPH)
MNAIGVSNMVDVMIVGSGPAGLSCAIEARKAGLSCIILEQGGVADAIRRFPTNLVWFSTPELLEVGGVPFVVPTTRPTRMDTMNYYQRVVHHFHLEIRTSCRVSAAQRMGSGFEVKTDSGESFQGRTVILATGYFDHPNRIGVSGEDLPHVFHYYDEPFRYHGTDVIVVGGRNSAVEAALDLYRHGARVTLVHRGVKLSEGVKYWILPDIENRIKQEQIRGLFGVTVERIAPGCVALRTPEGTKEVKADFVFVLVGFNPDTELLTSFGIRLDPETLAPCTNQETLETNIPGLFVAGSVVAGKNNNKIFVENGRLHAFQIIPAVQQRLGEGLS